MSGPKAKCPSCGSEWDGPVIFCGECGTPISQPPERVSTSGDRAARLPPPTPPPPPTPAASAAVPLGKISPPTRPSEPEIERKTAIGLNLKPTVTMAAVVAPPPVQVPVPERETKPTKAGRSRRKSLPAIHVEPSGAEETQRILEDLDAGFDSIVRPSDLPVPPASSQTSARMTVPMGMELFEPPPPAAPAPAPAPVVDPPAAATPEAAPAPVLRPEAEAEAAAARAAQHEADMAPVRALFFEMAVGYARPLRDFMIEVAWGEPSKEWLEIAAPAVAALRGASEKLGLPELSGALKNVADALDLAAGEASINREVKELVTGAYARLIEILPAAFALDAERGQRESIIVRSLLQQVPGVQKVALDRIWAAGLTSLSMFYAARARDLAEATGVDEEVAAAIVERFSDHRRRMADLAPGKERANERAELAALVAELGRVHDAHEGAARAWSAGAAARKTALLREREAVMLRVDVALAHLGQIGLQRDLARLPFQQKIRELTRYLEEARQGAARS